MLKEKYSKLSEPVKASVWYTVCNVLNKGVALLATPIFTRIMTEEEYGTFAVFQSWYGIILIFTSLNIFLGGYQKGLLLYRKDRERFTSTQLTLTTFITLVWFAIYNLNTDLWTRVFELQPVLMYLMFIELMLMPALEFWAAKERFDFKYKRYVVITLLMNVLILGSGAIAVMNTLHKVEAKIITEVTVRALFSGTLFVTIILKGKQLFKKEYWIYALRFNIPLLPHYLSNYVLNQSDRIMIGRMVGNDKAAYYSVSYTISTMMLLVITAINNSLTPFIYKKLDQFEQHEKSFHDIVKDIKRATTPLLIIVACLCTLTMAFAPEIILIFAGKNYLEAIYVIPPITASVFFIFIYSIFSNVEYYFQKTGYIAVATTICAVVNFLLNYIFIGLFGYFAAGYTTLVCYIALAVMHFIFYKKIIKNGQIKKDIYNITVVLACSIAVLTIMIGMIITYKIVFVRYAIILIMCIIAVIKRKQLISLVKRIR